MLLGAWGESASTHVTLCQALNVGTLLVRGGPVSADLMSMFLVFFTFQALPCLFHQILTSSLQDRHLFQCQS